LVLFFLVFSRLTLALGAIFLYDPFAHPLAAGAGQVSIGSDCLAFCFLAAFFLVWEADSWRSRRKFRTEPRPAESREDTFLPGCAGDAVRVRR
jgi:hypothetical protein